MSPLTNIAIVDWWFCRYCLLHVCVLCAQSSQIRASHIILAGMGPPVLCYKEPQHMLAFMRNCVPETVLVWAIHNPLPLGEEGILQTCSDQCVVEPC